MSHVNSFINQCHSILMGGTDLAFQAMRYLTEQRGLFTSTIKEKTIGYCPPNVDLPITIKHFGEHEECDRRDFSKFILGRIIVPIHDEFGKIVAFATRSINPEDGTTWWNTPFAKSNHLFLLGKSKKSIFQENKIYLVEGYMDAIVLQQYGVKSAVAVMGTNLTLRQMGLISRYCSNVCFCFDVDKNSSGQKAQKKSIIEINRFKIFDDLSIINGLPEGVDPDEFIIKNGKDEFLKNEKILDEKDIRLMSKSLKEKN